MKTLAALLVLVAVATVVGSAMAADQADAYAEQLGTLINRYREQHGLEPLARVAPLSNLAHEHAARMAKQDRLSHDGFAQRFAKAHSPTCVENVGTNYGTPEAEFEAWRRSASHNHNLLDPRIARMGLAIEGRYVAFFACR